MKRKRILLLLAVLCLFVGSFAVRAVEPGAPLIVDRADLLTTDEETALTAKASRLTVEYQMDVVILTVTSTDGQTPQHHAEDFYDRNGYAKDGILLLISMEERDWYICTTGNARKVFTEYGIEQLGDAFVPYLSGGEYAAAFNTFLDALPGYWDAFQNGGPIRERIGFTHVLICLCIGIAAGGITILIMRSTMKTDKQQHTANQYIRHDTFRLNVVHDQYLYSHVSKTPKQTNSSGGHGGGGGGHSHGGGGGKF